MTGINVPKAENAKLDAIFMAVDRLFVEHEADNYDRLNVLAKAAAYTLFWSKAPDNDAAISRYAETIRNYLQRIEMLNTEPAGSA